MAFPSFTLIELPVLQELSATGGSEEVRFLYQRLIAYFPQLDESEILEIKNESNKNWRKAVQKAGRNLDEQKLIKRNRGFWTLSEKGKQVVEQQNLNFSLPDVVIRPTSHLEIQETLVEIGQILGYTAQIEFEYYDVIWREAAHSPRISHVFEVQRKGNIDSAFAKLKRAYQLQRTKPFMVISTERDLNRAQQSLIREFQDIESVVTVMTFVQIKKIHKNLKSISDVLPLLLGK